MNNIDKLEMAMLYEAQHEHSVDAFQDLVGYIEDQYESKAWDLKYTVESIARTRNAIAKGIMYWIEHEGESECEILKGLYDDAYLITARDDFDSFCIALESHRYEKASGLNQKFEALLYF